MGTGSGGGYSDDLAKTAGSFGLDLGSIGGAFAGQDESPQVFFGDSPKRRVQSDDGRGATAGGVQTKTLAQANADFYRLSPREVEELQRRMVAAGILDPSKTRFGVQDDATYGAWSALNERAARFYAVGRRVTPDDALEMLGGSASGPEEVRRSAREVAAAAFRTADRAYTPSDPATLRQAAETAFRTTLGRKPTKAEQAKFVGSFLGAQRANQSADFAFDDSGVADSRRRTLADADADDAVAVTNKVNASLAGAGTGGAVGEPSGDPVETLLGAIGGQESGNNYGARNGRTGASGKYQIMPKNWPQWSAQAGLGSNAARTPENQEKVARYKMGEYVEKFGVEGAAVAWYGGPGAAQAWLKNPGAARFNKKQGKGNEPSINEYVQQVSSRMGGTDSVGSGSQSDQLWERVQRMIADSPYKISAGSRTRTYEEQVRLYEAYKAGRGPRAAKPGTSRHGDGRANDLTYSSDEARQWALENAGKYGLHFPVYDPKLARGRDESWHVELNGSPGNSYGAGPTGAGPAMGVAPLSRTRIDPEIDAGARAVEFARNSNPTETKAYDIGTTFQSFVNILGRGVI